MIIYLKNDDVAEQIKTTSEERPGWLEFYAMEIHRLLHFQNADMSAVSFAMTIHGLMDYELDQKYGYGKENQSARSLLDEYLKWFCDENSMIWIKM